MTPNQIQQLRQAINPQRIVCDKDELARHSHDCSPLAAIRRRRGNQATCPDLIVQPADHQEVSTVLAWASSNQVPVTTWGAGSAVTGAPLASNGGICLDLANLNQTLEINRENLTTRVGAGKLGGELEMELNEHGLTLNHSPQSLAQSTVGGWLSTRSSGQMSSRYGSIEDLCVSFTVVLPSGKIIGMPSTPRAAVGPDMRQLFIGAEGMLGVITDVALKMFQIPEYRTFESCYFPDLNKGLSALQHVMQSGLRPFLLRYYDADEAPHAMVDPQFKHPVLFLGCEGPEHVTKAEMATAIDICRHHEGQTMGGRAVKSWMKRRFDFSGIQRIIDKPGGVAETIEVCHYWDGIRNTYNSMRAGLKPLADQVVGHFSHAYPQGVSLYFILSGCAADDALAEKKLLNIWRVAMETCIQTGAAISHHHGVGLLRRQPARTYLGEAISVLEGIKQALDPTGIMNPGKLI